MARHLRVEFPGAIYHVSCRMIGDERLERSRLFGDDPERERFLERLGERVTEFNVRLYLFVLMTNHFHLVFETPEANCSRFMQSLSTAYTVYYNLRHRRHGHLLDGRYKAKLVEGDEYLLKLSRYVHLNPVMTGGRKEGPLAERIATLREYPWSSYPSYIGLRQPLDFVEYGPILGGMSGRRRDGPKRYREFVESGLAETDEDFLTVLKASPRCIGSDGFRSWIDEVYHQRLEKCARPEDVSFRGVTEPLPPEVVLGVLGGIFQVTPDDFLRRSRNSALRAVAARFLTRYSALSQRAVADLLKTGSGAAVCNQLARLPGKLAADRELRRRFQQADDRLRAARIARVPKREGSAKSVL